MFLILMLGLLAFAFAILTTPVVRDLLGELGFADHPDNIRKFHARPIPRVGGIAIVISYICAFGVVSLAGLQGGSSIDLATPQVVALIPAIAVIFLTGLIDDLIGLKPKQKLAGQIIASLLAYGAGIRIQIAVDEPLSIIWNSLLSVLWLVACTNAFNLIDGLDGLAAGVGLFATTTMLIAGLTQHNVNLLIVTVPLAGALLGFLRYNFNPASVFLGDCGSLLIGFTLGCCGVLWGNKSATLLGMTAPLMAVSIPLMDASLAVLRRFIRHQPIFGADRGHMHHRLLERGFSPKRVALVIYGVSGIAAAFSLIQSAAHDRYSGATIVLFCAAAWIGIQHLGYVEFGMARQIFMKGTMRILIDGQTRLNHLERSLINSQNLEQCWIAVVDGSRDFGFTKVQLRVRDASIQEMSDPTLNEPIWRITIPLVDSQFVYLHRGVDNELHPLMVSAFVQVVRTALNRRLLQESENESPHLRREYDARLRRLRSGGDEELFVGTSLEG